MEPLVQAWLERQCAVLPGVSRAVAIVALRGQDDVVVCWPEAMTAPELESLARRAASERGPVVREQVDTPGAPPKCWQAAVPFVAGGAFAVEVSQSDMAVAEDLVALLRCSAAGLQIVATRDSGAAGPDAEVVAAARLTLEHERYADAALAVSTDVATRAGCERVSIGFSRRGRVRVEAMSHSARFRENAALARDVAAAMDEAADQDSVLVHPPAEGTPLRVTCAHELLAERHGSGVVCTIPLARGNRVVGAMTFEWAPGAPPNPAVFALCNQTARLLGPVLSLKRDADERLFDRVREQLRTHWARLVGPGHPALKAGAIALLVALAAVALAQGTYRVSAPAKLEGRVQRAVVAGFDGYISEANARAGDLVRQGQVLGRLDARDLSLEKRKLRGRIEQLRREYREAFAGHDRTQVSIISAKKAQAEAQLALLDEQLARTRLVAPFDGVVVEGDLTQSLGSPVAKGDLLFQVAPLDGYRIILAVDERDIAEVGVGQRGSLALSAMPGRPLPLTVERLTPVATHDEGRNAFRVEARLDKQMPALRPGMEGIAKIEVEERQLLWIWTHDLVDWLRLWAWSWWP